jgi:cytochrome c5
VSTHDQHSSFVKTPQQLIVVILLAFLVPIIGIVLLVQLVVSQPGADPAALTPEAVAARIRPVGRIEIGPASAPPGTRSAGEVVKAVCTVCHQAGVANAPKLGDAKDWAPRIKQGLNAMVQSVLKGKGAMPPKAGDASLTENEITRAVVAMANQAGGKFKEPAAPKPEAQAPAKPAAVTPAPVKPEAVAAAPAKPGAADGKALYDKVCVACHQQSVAGSPPLGDKAAWAPRVQTGVDALVQSVIKGKGAMPPKAGNPALSEAEIRAAVEFMVSQSK